MTELPCKTCRGKCCTYPAMSKVEFKTLVRRYGLPDGSFVKKFEHVDYYDSKVKSGDIGYVVHLANGTCPWLLDGRCSVYKHRPKVCKDYGVVDKLPCEYLYPEKARQMVEESMKRARELSSKKR